VLAPERMHQGDQRGASRVRCLLLHQRLVRAENPIRGCEQQSCVPTARP
jgi:hypothetical protein